ncbi:MAG TPA: hypothetical protein VK439_09200 [Rubrivivax sp.]|nr:hypothetical protein [Rubrivivax sp.]
MTRLAWGLLAVCVLTACGERSQSQETRRKVDAHPHEGAASAFTAGGWQPGNAASWEQQMRARAQGQNEYSRTAAQ